MLGASRPFRDQVDLTCCPAHLDENFSKRSRCAQHFDTNLFLQDQFGGFKLVGKNSMLLRIAKVLGKGSLNAGTFVVQVFHWFYVGRPRATTSYRACVNVLLSSSKLHLSMLKNLTQVHSIQTVFDRCSHRSQTEMAHIYTVSSLDRSKNRERLSLVSVA